MKKVVLIGASPRLDELSGLILGQSNVLDEDLPDHSARKGLSVVKGEM
jgi:hypothetical protein